MLFLVLRAYFRLIQFDFYLSCGKFEDLYKKVHNCPVNRRATCSDAIERVCSAVDMACIWYWKEVLCLQRSSATACLLKTFGAHSELIIGARQMPFKAHAWVEIDGRIVNDKPYLRQVYAVLDRC